MDRAPDRTGDSDGNDEPALRAAVLRGDGAAWELLYERARAPVRRWLGRRSQGSELDDLVQETWMVAVRKMRGFDPKLGTFTGWMLGIAAKTALAHRRHAKLDRPEAWIEPGEPGQIRSDGSAASSSRRSTTGSTQDLVQETLRALPPRYRTVLQAKYELGLRVDEIASRCGSTAKAIESLLTRARDAFRALYHPEEDSP